MTPKHIDVVLHCHTCGPVIHPLNAEGQTARITPGTTASSAITAGTLMEIGYQIDKCWREHMLNSHSTEV